MQQRKLGKAQWWGLDLSSLGLGHPASLAGPGQLEGCSGDSSEEGLTCRQKPHRSNFKYSGLG